MQTQRRNNSSENGIVLILVIIVLTIISTIVVDFVFSTQIDYEISANTIKELKADYIAKSGVNVLSGTFKTRDLEQLAKFGSAVAGIEVENKDKWSLKVPTFPVGEGFVTMVIEDERSKINLNGLVNSATNRIDFQVLTALTELFRYQGVENDKVQLFLASLINWLDRPLEGSQNDQDSRGAGNDYYQSLDNPYTIKDGPLDSVAEIKMIKGMDEDFYNAVKDYVTVYPSNKQVNFSTASKPVMIAVLKAAEVSAIQQANDSSQKLDDDLAGRIADAIIDERQKDPVVTRREVRDTILDIDSSIGLSSGLSGLVLNSGTSEIFSINSTGIIGEENPVISNVAAVVNKKRVGRSSEIDIISWKQR